MSELMPTKHIDLLWLINGYTSSSSEYDLSFRIASALRYSLHGEFGNANAFHMKHYMYVMSSRVDLEKTGGENQ